MERKNENVYHEDDDDLLTEIRYPVSSSNYFLPLVNQSCLGGSMQQRNEEEEEDASLLVWRNADKSNFQSFCSRSEMHLRRDFYSLLHT